MVFDCLGSPGCLCDDAVSFDVEEGDDRAPEPCEERVGRELGEHLDVAVILFGHELKYEARRDGEGEGIMSIDGWSTPTCDGGGAWPRGPRVCRRVRSAWPGPCGERWRFLLR